MHILVVEDDVVTAAKIELVLQDENFLCDTTHLGEVAVNRAKLLDYDIIILDLMLPDMTGYEVLRELRAAGVHTPVLILSGLGEVDDKIKGLSFGADDFLTKPFEARELIARIHAIVRRAKGHAASTVRTGKLLVNLDSRTALIGDQRLRISPKEYQILELLSLRKGNTLTKSASCGESSRKRPAASITSRPCAAAAISCAIRSPPRRNCSAPDIGPYLLRMASARRAAETLREFACRNRAAWLTITAPGRAPIERPARHSSHKAQADD